MKVLYIFVLQSVLVIYNNFDYKLHNIIDGVSGAHPLNLNLKLRSRITHIIEFVEITLRIVSDKVISLMDEAGPMFASFNIAGYLEGFY